MSSEDLKILIPFLAALVGGSLPALIGGWLSRRKVSAEASSVLVMAATNATKELLAPLTAEVARLRAEIVTINSDKLRLSLDLAIAKEGIAKLETNLLIAYADRNQVRSELDEAKENITALTHEYSVMQEQYANVMAENQALRACNEELTDTIKRVIKEKEGANESNQVKPTHAAGGLEYFHRDDDPQAGSGQVLWDR